VPINAEQQPEPKRVVAKFRSLSVDKELELLWHEINAINDTLQKLVEVQSHSSSHQQLRMTIFLTYRLE
jgi:hypothetical protein